MVVPIVFRRSSPGGTYDWVDVLGGVGYRTFYPCYADISTGDVAMLVVNPDFVSSPRMAYTTVAGTPVAGQDHDFDLLFNESAIIRGDMHFNIMAGTNGATMTCKVNVYHVSTGAVETSLGSVTSGNYAPGAMTYYIIALKLAIAEKRFRVGEKLRVNIQFNHTAAQQITFYHNPKGDKTEVDHVGVTIPTTTRVDVPFKLET